MAWKLEGAMFVDGDGGLAYSVNLYAKGEMNGEVIIQRKGPLTEAQAASLGFDLSDVLTELNTQSLNALDAAREDVATKAAHIATLEGDLKLAAEERDNLSGRLNDALSQVAALQLDLAKSQLEAAARIAALEAERNELAAVVAEQTAALNAQSNAPVVAEEGAVG